MIELMDELVFNQIHGALIYMCPQCGSSVLQPPKEICVCVICGCVALQREFHPANRKFVEVN